MAHDLLPRTGHVPAPPQPALRVLRREGTRGRGDVRHSRLGAAYLALVTGAPVVPVAHVGLARLVQDAVLLTGQRLPADSLDLLEEAPGRGGHEVGPESEERAS